MEITAEMHRAGLAAFEEWRAAPLGVGHGDVVSRVLTAALDAAPTSAPALLPPADNEHVAEGASLFAESIHAIEGAAELVVHKVEDALGLLAQGGAEAEPPTSLPPLTPEAPTTLEPDPTLESEVA